MDKNISKIESDNTSCEEIQKKIRIDDLKVGITCALASIYSIKSKKSKVKEDLKKSFLISSLASLVISIIANVLIFNILGVEPTLKLIVSNFGHMFANQFTVVAGVHGIAFLVYNLISNHRLELNKTKLKDLILEFRETTEPANVTKKTKIDTSEIIYGNTQLDVTLKELKKEKANIKGSKKHYLKLFPIFYAIGLLFCATIINFLGNGTVLAHGSAYLFFITGEYLITTPMLYVIIKYIIDNNHMNKNSKQKADIGIETLKSRERIEQKCKDFKKDDASFELTDSASMISKKIEILHDFRSRVAENRLLPMESQYAQMIEEFKVKKMEMDNKVIFGHKKDNYSGMDN